MSVFPEGSPLRDGDPHHHLAVWDAWASRSSWLADVTARRGDEDVARSALADLPEVSALDALAANAAAVDLLVGRRWYVMRDAREAGATWEQIAAAVGGSVDEAKAYYVAAIEKQEKHVPAMHDAARSRAVLDDAAGSGVVWESRWGAELELRAVGDRVTFTAVVDEDGENEHRYVDAPGVIVGHDLEDDVAPYRVRLDTGETVSAEPFHLDSAD